MKNTPMVRSGMWLSLVCISAAVWSEAAWSETSPPVKDVMEAQPAPVEAPVSTTDLLNLLVNEGVVNKDSAIKMLNALRKRAEQTPSIQTKTTAKDQVVVPYLPANVEARLLNQLSQKVAKETLEEAKRSGVAPPPWVNVLTVSGDVRVRYNDEQNPSDNPILPEDSVFNLNEINRVGSTAKAGRDAYLNVNENRHRLQGRARLRLNAKPADHFDVGIGLTTGENGNPVSANQTMGRYGAKWETNFDLAYIDFKNNDFNLKAGRFQKPWQTADLMWDRDMTFEGVFGQAFPLDRFTAQKGWNTYLNVGAFPIQEIHKYKFPDEALYAPDDKWLYSLGLGTQLRWYDHHKLTASLTYYQFKNVTGTLNLPGQDSQNPSAPRNFQWGNVVKNISVALPGEEQKELYALAAEYEPVDLALSYVYSGLAKHELTLNAEYLKNTAWDAAAVNHALNLTNQIPDRDTGQQIEMGFGTRQKSDWGDWGATLTYRKLEGDATLDSFADSDFLMGGTNAQGFIIKMQQFIAHNVWLEFSLLSADEVDYPILQDRPDLRKRTYMLDINARF